MLSAYLEQAFGGYLRKSLHRMTKNRFLGVLTGTAVTALVQSSTAVTVMVLGFVDNGMMSLRQAVWVILGANIGTTFTGKLAALPVQNTALPLLGLGGALVLLKKRTEKLNCIGSVLVGAGMLFLGMEEMELAMLPFRESQVLLGLLTECRHPLAGILGGTIFTALIQSSSASVAILQTMADSGMISLEAAAYVVFGQNIGTCVTALLASLGTGKHARQAACVHLLINVIGTCFFALPFVYAPFLRWMEAWNAGDPAMQVANLHLMFNLISTVLLLPFDGLLVKLAENFKI